jgi:hypothetical protein
MLPVYLDCPFFIAPSVFFNFYIVQRVTLGDVYIKIAARIGGVMVRLLASSAVYRGSSPGQVKPKTIKLVLVSSPLSTQH